ncbi:MAG: choice-of-anchor L domain-containing protein [Kofleriaceae bacterium]
MSLALVLTATAACGPSARNECNANTDTQSDPDNCGACGVQCNDGDVCEFGLCEPGPCTPGDTRSCYSGPGGTEGVGECRAGIQTCDPGGDWAACTGEVTPRAEDCSNGLDDNCTGEADEDTDADGDGFTTCGGDCCDTIECSRPELVNPNAFEDDDNGVDDNCDGVVDEVEALCDTGLSSASSDPLDYARAIDLCRVATEDGVTWGVISATLTLPDGTGLPAEDSRSIRDAFGPNVTPQAGARLIELSSGVAADANDSNPASGDFSGDIMNTESDFPADFLAANGGSLPNAPGCPGPNGSTAFDAVMLTLRIRTPSNARSFSLSTNFFSAEYPEWVCSPYNDFFLVLLDSAYAGDPANPADKNLATYTAADGAVYPVGVNLAYGNTGLFRECQNGATGCEFGATPGNQTTCTSSSQLLGTGFDEPSPGACAAGSVLGGGTGWLTTSGNVLPGEVITVRIAVWDTSDPVLDSLAVIDNFRWSIESTDPGTILE